MHEAISTLIRLAEVSRDGEAGFKSAAESAKDGRLKDMFMSASKRCSVGAKELDSEIIKLGGTPSASGTVSGAIYRGWTNVKDAIIGADEKTVLAECERGEDAAKAAYKVALTKDLTPDLLSIIRRQYQGVKENHDLMKELRDAA
jgi:uncharacterized protein (TIGR02284 family)